MPVRSNAAPLVTGTSIIFLGGNQYFCSLMAYDANLTAPLWEMHTQPGCQLNTFDYSGIFQISGQMVFRIQDGIFQLTAPRAAPAYSVTTDHPVTKALLELRTIFTAWRRWRRSARRNTSRLRHCPAKGAFAFRDVQSQYFSRARSHPLDFR